MSSFPELSRVENVDFSLRAANLKTALYHPDLRIEMHDSIKDEAVEVASTGYPVDIITVEDPEVLRPNYIKKAALLADNLLTMGRNAKAKLGVDQLTDDQNPMYSCANYGSTIAPVRAMDF